jgi:hypothetical protein
VIGEKRRDCSWNVMPAIIDVTFRSHEFSHSSISSLPFGRLRMTSAFARGSGISINSRSAGAIREFENLRDLLKRHQLSIL